MIARMMAAAKRLFALTLSPTAALQSRFHRRLSEWHMAVVMLACGISLMLGPTFDLEPFAVVRQIADQPSWAVAMAVVGGVRLIILVINGALRGSPHLRAFLAFVSALIWLGLLAGLWPFGKPLLVVPFLATAILVEWVTIYRTAHDARNEDDSIRSGARNGHSG